MWHTDAAWELCTPSLKPHLNNQWVIPPDANDAFVAAMEDVIEVYHRPHDPKLGRPKRVDYEYERNGTANLFMMFAPLEG